MPQELFGKRPDDSLDKHLYDAGLEVAKERIRQSQVFNLLLFKDTEDNLSLRQQIQYAKELGKPFYILVEQGAKDPPELAGADVRARETYASYAPGVIEAAIELLWQHVRRDFPDARWQIHQTPDLNGIVNWPPKQ